MFKVKIMDVSGRKIVSFKHGFIVYILYSVQKNKKYTIVNTIT